MSETESIDHSWTEEVVCPYCGFTYTESHELFGTGQDYATARCEDCDKEFKVSRECEVTYCTYKFTAAPSQADRGEK